VTGSRPEPSVSIVTACYNSSTFICRLYQSLVTQEFRDFEWICVDDCSTDGTISLLKSLEPPGGLGMQVYQLPFNTGGPVATAVGIQKARGEIILIFDHDDELLPGALKAVVAAWPAISRDESLCGLMFPIKDGLSGEVIGKPIETGTRIATTWLSNRRPDISDATFVLKANVAKKAFAIRNVEEVTMFSVILNQITSEQPALAAATPIRAYHRDNPNSQTLSVRVSRKMVATYAALLSEWDRWYWFALGRWIRHSITLLRFSKDVHGSMMAAVRLVRRPSLRMLLIILMPIAAVVRSCKPHPRLVEYPVFTPDIAETLVNFHTG
jgi:glycosyltransferase involved in cell wall biosynthesis